MSSPTQRSLEYLRERYPLVSVVEHWNSFARKRYDLWGFADILCVGKEIVAVQTTSGSHVAHRIQKITDSPATPILREAGIRIVVHGWRKSRGKWVLREVDVS